MGKGAGRGLRRGRGWHAARIPDPPKQGRNPFSGSSQRTADRGSRGAARQEWRDRRIRKPIEFPRTCYQRRWVSLRSRARPRHGCGNCEGRGADEGTRRGDRRGEASRREGKARLCKGTDRGDARPQSPQSALQRLRVERSAGCDVVVGCQLHCPRGRHFDAGERIKHREALRAEELSAEGCESAHGSPGRAAGGR